MHKPAWMEGLDMTESRRIEQMVRSVDHDALARKRAQATLPPFRTYRGTYEQAERADLVRAITDAFREAAAQEEI